MERLEKNRKCWKNSRGVNMNNQENKKDHKPVTIIVNGREKEWTEKRITFKQVVTLAFGTYEENELIVYTVTYKYKSHKEGTMVAGDEVKVHEGMIFNVTRTDKS